MKDKPIRDALLRQLSADDPSAAIYEELHIARGEGRADCASVNGHLVGFEIKSDSDSLSRLGKQVFDYEKVFDYCNVVVARKHLRRVRMMIPGHWGIIVADACDATNSVLLHRRRKARLNRKTCLRTLVRLLWKTEAAAILRAHGRPLPVSLPVREMWAALEAMPKTRVAHEIRAALKLRAGFPALPLLDDDSRRTEPTAAVRP
jgi:hypothetical protein